MKRRDVFKRGVAASLGVATMALAGKGLVGAEAQWIPGQVMEFDPVIELEPYTQPGSVIEVNGEYHTLQALPQSGTPGAYGPVFSLIVPRETFTTSVAALGAYAGAHEQVTFVKTDFNHPFGEKGFVYEVYLPLTEVEGDRYDIYLNDELIGEGEAGAVWCELN